MSDGYNPQEILKIAINVEKNGQKLYQALEEKADNEKIKEVWKFLKEQEVKHREFFEEMLENQGQYITNEKIGGEVDSYMRAIASEYIVTPEVIEKKAQELFGSDLEAINFGIYIEKESIAVYSAFKEYVTLDKQPVLDKVIQEEKDHYTKLSLLKQYLKKES